MAQIIKGDDLMLFDTEGNSLAFATSHSLSINGEASDTSSKDHGVWKGTEVNKLSWEISSENLYTGNEYDRLFSMMVAREAIDVFFGTKAEGDPEQSVADGDYENWTFGNGYKGKVFITSLVANANSGENATYSVTLTGTGKITKAA